MLNTATDQEQKNNSNRFWSRVQRLTCAQIFKIKTELLFLTKPEAPGEPNRISNKAELVFDPVLPHSAQWINAFGGSWLGSKPVGDRYATQRR